MISHTRQEWFELAVRGLAKQGWRRSINSIGDCQMQGRSGMRCAIGQGIRLELTRKRIDKRDSQDGYSLAKEGVVGVDGLTTCKAGEFLNAMQERHDGSLEGDEMRKAFIQFGANRRLTWPADVAREGEII
jgi:hypothetical protein